MRRRQFLVAAVTSVVLAALFPFGKEAQTAPLEKDELVKLVETIDERQRSVGDYKARVFIEQREGKESELAYEAAIYRRDQEGKLVILFTRPKSEAGKGYLRIDRNLFLYDPSVGKWERRTERENIGGTNSQRRDFDASNFAENYNPSYVAEEKLGKFGVHHIKLEAKKGKDVAYPVLHVWVDTESRNVLKVQEYALSGRLMRTAYYPKWRKVDNPAKGSPVYFPTEIRIYDEVEKGNSTTITLVDVALEALEAKVFTKSFIESKSR